MFHHNHPAPPILDLPLHVRRIVLGGDEAAHVERINGFALVATQAAKVQLMCVPIDNRTLHALQDFLCAISSFYRLHVVVRDVGEM